MKNHFKISIGILITTLVIVLACRKEKNIHTVYNIPDGFELEDLFSPSEAGFGSWVSITEGPGRQFFTCDQHGDIYTFKMSEIGQNLEVSDVDSIDLNIGYAQGLLWAFNSLYVTLVKEFDEENPDDPSSGVYRLKDLNNDGELDHMEKILTVTGNNEHGPHTMRVSPDEQSL